MSQTTTCGDPTPARAIIEAARVVRAEARAGRLTGTTANAAPGAVQGNIVILPKDWAAEFLRFCSFNPKPCPLVGMSEPGDPMLPTLGQDVDIRTDVPAYRVFENGKEVDVVYDIRKFWREDLVTFVLGCSFSFEEALLSGGLSVRHIEQDTVVPMYRTTLKTVPAGRFHGPVVVTMRPFTPVDAIRAIQITSRFPSVHGAPLHFGDPKAIGIADIDKPEYGGQPVAFRPGEVPVFWACGVTPQAAHRECPATLLHHASPRLDAGDRPPELSDGGAVRAARRSAQRPPGRRSLRSRVPRPDSAASRRDRGPGITWLGLVASSFSRAYPRNVVSKL